MPIRIIGGKLVARCGFCPAFVRIDKALAPADLSFITPDETDAILTSVGYFELSFHVANGRDLCGVREVICPDCVRNLSRVKSIVLARISDMMRDSLHSWFGPVVDDT